MSYDCMQVSKLLGMAFTSAACTSHLLHKIKEEKLQFKSSLDIRGGLISAAGILKNTPINKHTNEALLQKFQKASRSVDAVDKALKKEKAITPEVAATYVKKIDKALEKVGDLWEDVRDQVCKGKK